MKVTEEGLALIRSAEGFRSDSYRDVSGVWTIGFGHTSAAGESKVISGQHMTQDEAELLLRRDVEAVAVALQLLIKVPLSDQQFSALVSLAYNIGVAAFQSSSALKALNAGNFAAVPERMQLWVKAGGRRVGGLVKRRATEAELFMQGTAEAPTRQEPRVDQVTGPKLYRSTTIWAALSALVFAALEHVALALGYGVLAIAMTGLIGGAAWWIIRERMKKIREQGV